MPESDWSPTGLAQTHYNNVVSPKKFINFINSPVARQLKIPEMLGFDGRYPASSNINEVIKE